MRATIHLIVCALLACAGAAQNANPGTDAPGGADAPEQQAISGTLPEMFAQVNAQEPIRRAGLRAALLRQAQIVVPIVVIVDDAEGYLSAVSNWEGMIRFPVLWDDGSVRAREDIARFVRAFDPERVLRLDDDGGFAWSGSPEDKREQFERALTRAVSERAGSWREPLRELAAQGVKSPGIVITDPTDDSWAAALALAAGRVQPVDFVTKASNVWKPMSVEDSDALERQIEHAATRTGRSWREIGDDIDTVTLALNTGTQIKTGGDARSRLATTDRIGRTESIGAGDRWAWCGQIIGDEARGVYQAMCSLFLRIDQAFIWDGYGDGPPWSTYDGTRAGEVLTSVGIETEVNDQPRNGIGDWTLRMVNPVGDDAAGAGTSLLMLMNSKGGSRQFALPDGRGEGWGKPGDIPTLEVPAVMHMVHSFSLQTPMNRQTVGGRLLERGVYAYAGSVDEPYLQAFVPTPGVARRLAATMPLAAAARFDDGKAWKITVLGDPLVTVGPAGRRVSSDIEVEGVADLEARSKERLKAGDFAGAIEDLVMLGRDEDVARLARALMDADSRAAFTPEIAMLSVPSLRRAGEFVSMFDAYERLGDEGRGEGLMRDLLWLSSPYLLARGGADAGLLARVEAMLRANLRSDQKIQDAEKLAMHLRERSLDRALGVLEGLRAEMKNDNQKTMLDRAIDRVKR